MAVIFDCGYSDIHVLQRWFSYQHDLSQRNAWALSFLLCSNILYFNLNLITLCLLLVLRTEILHSPQMNSARKGLIHILLACAGSHSMPSSGRLFHSPLAQHQRQAICLPLGLCKGLSVAFEKWWKFPPWMHCKLSKIQCGWGIPPTIFGLANHTIGKIILFEAMFHTPTDSSPATRLGLWSSLAGTVKQSRLGLWSSLG